MRAGVEIFETKVGSLFSKSSFQIASDVMATTSVTNTEIDLDMYDVTSYVTTVIIYPL